MINSTQFNSVSKNGLMSGFSSPSAKKGGNSKLSIFYINDMHGNIDNMSGMIAASDKFDKKAAQKPDTDVLKLSGGDNFSGGDEKKNKLVVNLLSRMGIKFSAVGNHEFDSTIGSFYKYLTPDKTKFLAANAKTPEGSQFYNNVQKSEIVEVNGTKYGIVGLLPFDLETVTGKDDKKLEGIRPENIDNSINIVNEETKKLAAQGVDRIVLVSHIGNDMDKLIAPKLHGVDVIVGGHSHTEVENVEVGQNLFNNADGNPIVIVQTGENAKNVGILNIEFDEKGVPVSAENNLVRTTQEKSPILEYAKDTTLGKSPEICVIDTIDAYPDNRRTTPCAWTNFMCDAMRDELGTDIAFINAANTRKVPKAGKLTERDVLESTPMKNTLLVKKMTEKEIVRAIKEAVKETYSKETSEPGILHASGLSYTADTLGNLHELSFVDKQGNKTPIDINNPSDKAYSVCYDSFVAKGTEYPVFVPETMTYPEIDKSFDFDKGQVAINYLKKFPSVGLTIQDDHRIVILDKGQAAFNKADDTNKPSVSLHETPVKAQAYIQPQMVYSNPVMQNSFMAQQALYNPYSNYYMQPLNSTAAMYGYSGMY